MCYPQVADLLLTTDSIFAIYSGEQICHRVANHDWTNFTLVLKEMHKIFQNWTEPYDLPLNT